MRDALRHRHPTACSTGPAVSILREESACLVRAAASLGEISSMALGILIGAVLGGFWIYGRIQHKSLSLADLILAIGILCAFTLASGILSKFSPPNPAEEAE